jgi:hypothetical protein
MADDLSSADLTVGSPTLSTAALVNKLTLRVVEERHKQFGAGEDWALLDAVDFCARAGVVMPEWLAEAFCQRYLDWHLFQAKTLADAFGVARSKREHAKKRADRERLKPRVVLEVLRQRRKDETLAIDEELFRRVGEVLNISGGQANKIYYDSANHWRKPLPQIVTADTKI